MMLAWTRQSGKRVNPPSSMQPKGDGPLRTCKLFRALELAGTSV